MTIKRFFAFLAVSVVAATASVFASGFASQSVKIDFTNEEDAKSKATWGALYGSDNGINISKDGLGLDGSPNSRHGGWFMTKPVGVGFSFRPAQNVQTISDIHLAFEKNTTCQGILYMRYSADGKHWSSWQRSGFYEEIKEEKAKKDEEAKNAKTKKEQSPRYRFPALTQVPNLVRKDYGKLLSEYEKLDVPWPSDQEAAVKWILEKNPKFFEGEPPFIGYVQFLYEDYWIDPKQRIAAFSVSIVYDELGMYAPPKDMSDHEYRKGPWRFKAE